MPNITKNQAADFLINNLHFTVPHAHAVVAKLTVEQTQAVPGLTAIAIRLSPIIISLSENILSIENCMQELLRLLRANHDNYQLKIWHVTNIFQSYSYLGPIISEIQESRTIDSQTLGTRQCAQSEIKSDFKYYNLLDKVFGVKESNLIGVERDAMEVAIPALKKLVQLMNATIATTGLSPATVFTDFINRLSNRTSADIELPVLKPPVAQALIAPLVANHTGKNYLRENFSENFAFLQEMEIAFDSECSRLYRCDSELRGYYPFLKMNAKFLDDPEQVRVAHKSQHYLENYLRGHDAMCRNVGYYSYNFVPQVSRAGLFKSNSSLHPLYTNFSNALDNCDYKNMAPFMYFYTLTPLVAASAVAGVEIQLLETGSADANHDMSDSSESHYSNYYLLILLYLAFLLVALHRQRRLVAQTPVDSAAERVALLDDDDIIAAMESARPGSHLQPGR